MVVWCRLASPPSRAEGTWRPTFLARVYNRCHLKSEGFALISAHGAIELVEARSLEIIRAGLPRQPYGVYGTSVCTCDCQGGRGPRRPLDAQCGRAIMLAGCRILTGTNVGGQFSPITSATFLQCNHCGRARRYFGGHGQVEPLKWSSQVRRNLAKMNGRVASGLGQISEPPCGTKPDN